MTQPLQINDKDKHNKHTPPSSDIRVIDKTRHGNAA
jgi:hypothetical protein